MPESELPNRVSRRDSASVRSFLMRVKDATVRLIRRRRESKFGRGKYFIDVFALFRAREFKRVRTDLKAFGRQAKMEMVAPTSFTVSETLYGTEEFEGRPAIVPR